MQTLNDVISTIKPLEPLKLSLVDAYNLTLAEDIYALIDLPSFNKSAMDGYAISSLQPTYQISGSYSAGMVPPKLAVGTCCYISTGCMLPSNTYAVLKKEDVDIKGDNLISIKPIKAQQFICFKGEEVSKDTLIFKKGTKLTYAHLGLLKAQGYQEVLVYPKAKIKLIVSGDELSENPKLGQIYDSNGLSLSLFLKQFDLNCDISYLSDNKTSIDASLEDASHQYDLIITTGGASVGKKDFMDSLNQTYLIKRLNYKPGGNVFLAKRNQAYCLHLSGNPIAAFVSLVSVGLSVIEALSQLQLTKVLVCDYSETSVNKHTYIPGYYEYRKKLQVTSVKHKKGNGMISNAIDCNCLISLKPNSLNQKVEIIVWN